jgi:hypothetical protein
MLIWRNSPAGEAKKLVSAPSVKWTGWTGTQISARRTQLVLALAKVPAIPCR